MFLFWPPTTMWCAEGGGGGGGTTWAKRSQLLAFFPPAWAGAWSLATERADGCGRWCGSERPMPALVGFCLVARGVVFHGWRRAWVRTPGTETTTARARAHFGVASNGRAQKLPVVKHGALTTFLPSYPGGFDPPDPSLHVQKPVPGHKIFPLFVILCPLKLTRLSWSLCV